MNIKVLLMKCDELNHELMGDTPSLALLRDRLIELNNLVGNLAVIVLDEQAARESVSDVVSRASNSGKFD